MESKLKKERHQRTSMREAYLESYYNVEYIYECEFMELKRKEPALMQMIYDTRPLFYRMHKAGVSEEMILNSVVKNELYGFVECNIEVPLQWGKCFKSDISPYEYFCEMSPLFCTSDIDFDHMGEHLKQFIEEHNLSKKPRRLLVGGMKAEKILLHSTLLKWYIDHGMKVTDVFEVIEFIPLKCFEKFADTVVEARRAASIDPTKSVIAQTWKSLGNSAFGSVIMNKTKHRDIKYLKGKLNAAVIVNDNRFRKLSEIDNEEDYFEAELNKKFITLDLPIQIGFTILQFAKLRILQFYYDFLCYFIDRSNFELGEMDTDSIYFAITEKTLEDVVKPEKKHEFYNLIYENCKDIDIIPSEGKFYIPRKCCDKHYKWDSKVPGIFKIEYEGDELIGLNSKCYIGAEIKFEKINKMIPPNQLKSRQLINKARKIKQRSFSKIYINSKIKRLGVITHKVKVSCKGVSKRHLKKPLYTFRKVLHSKTMETSKNIGFIFKSNKILVERNFQKVIQCFYFKL